MAQTPVGRNGRFVGVIAHSVSAPPHPSKVGAGFVDARVIGRVMLCNSLSIEAFGNSD